MLDEKFEFEIRTNVKSHNLHLQKNGSKLFLRICTHFIDMMCIIQALKHYECRSFEN